WSHFTSFFSGAGRVLLRDALSAAKISPLRGSEATLACDCAFLLKPEDVALLKGFAPASERKGVGLFFGRSPQRARMMRFAKTLAAEMGEECRWLPWFGTRRRHRMLAKIQNVEIPAGEVPPGELLARLSGCRFVVTDTYHMCVNAWRMGIPAVCLGQGAGATSSSLSDKKKEILYEMYGARALYVFVESLRGRGLKQEAKQVAEALRQDGLTAQVAATVGLHRETAERRLAEALHAALS
ncbi:MAG: polysaccharide pyruvyl transferase family protein, partial [Alphaproteobacteria bacterium]|nr:polysaccharide pyruvyl transferase family protein [Alphaproteobacteria bacterium]